MGSFNFKAVGLWPSVERASRPNLGETFSLGVGFIWLHFDDTVKKASGKFRAAGDNVRQIK